MLPLRSCLGPQTPSELGTHDETLDGARQDFHQVQPEKKTVDCALSLPYRRSIRSSSRQQLFSASRLRSRSPDTTWLSIWLEQIDRGLYHGDQRGGAVCIGPMSIQPDPFSAMDLFSLPEPSALRNGAGVGLQRRVRPRRGHINSWMDSKRMQCGPSWLTTTATYDDFKSTPNVG